MKTKNVRRALAPLLTVLLAACAWAQQGVSSQAGSSAETYLSDVASHADNTGGKARLLHYLSTDMPIAVYVPPPDAKNGQALRDAVVRAVKAWQNAAPDVVQFVIVGKPGSDATSVRWQHLDTVAASYRYAYTVTAQNQYRFHATELILDPRNGPDETYRLALLVLGQSLGMLGRSPYQGDALSVTPSGAISERDVATLRALYNVPSGTVLGQ